MSIHVRSMESLSWPSFLGQLHVFPDHWSAMVSQAGIWENLFKKQTLLVCSRKGHTKHLPCFIQSLAPIRMLKKLLLIALELDFVGISPLAL